MHTDRGRNIVDGSLNKQIPICRDNAIDPSVLTQLDVNIGVDAEDYYRIKDSEKKKGR